MCRIELGNRGAAPESLKADLIVKSSDMFFADPNAISEAAFLTVFLGMIINMITFMSIIIFIFIIFIIVTNISTHMLQQ